MLRQEAQAFSLEELDLEQLGAASRILEMLDEAAAAIPDERTAEAPRSPRLAMRLDRARRSMVAFLDGARGMGKTSILLTLMRAFDEGGNLAENGEEEEPQRKRRLGEVGEKIKHLRDRVIWLETLDLEPVASNTNLLAAILARIERRAEELLGHRERGAFSDEETDALGALRNLMREVGFAWEGNVRERASSLDPELYAEEVIAAELARLNFNERLEKVLVRLSRQIEDAVPGMVRKPLFVLPVDDLDLNPTFTLDLLRLVRAVYCPRLFTVMLGDMEMTDRVVTARYFGELTQPFGHRAEFWPNGTEDVQIAARETAAHALRKLIPPGQRVILRPISLEEALRFKPSGEKRILKDILMGIHLFIESPLFVEGYTNKIENFAQYMTIEASNNLKYLWDACRIFETSRRRIIDIYYKLDHLSKTKSQEDIEYEFIDILINAVQEDQFISPALRNELLETLRSTSKRDFFHTHFLFIYNQQPVHISPTYSYLGYYDDKERYINENHSLKLIFYKTKISIVASKISNPELKEARERYSACSPYLENLAMIVKSINNYGMAYKLFPMNNLRFNLISAQHYLANITVSPIEISWKIPSFSSSRDYSIFSNIFFSNYTKFMDQSTGNYTMTEKFFLRTIYVWVASFLEVITNGKFDIEKDYESEIEIENIEKLFKYLCDFDNKFYKKYGRKFVPEIIINLCPECGIPVNVVEKLIKIECIFNSISHDFMYLSYLRNEIWFPASFSSNNPLYLLPDQINSIRQNFEKAEHPFNESIRAAQNRSSQSKTTVTVKATLPPPGPNAQNQPS